VENKIIKKRARDFIARFLLKKESSKNGGLRVISPLLAGFKSSQVPKWTGSQFKTHNLTNRTNPVISKEGLLEAPDASN